MLLSDWDSPVLQVLFSMQALVECEGEAIDLSGDVGAVGRVVISDNPSGNHDMFFDLKGKFVSFTLRALMDSCYAGFHIEWPHLILILLCVTGTIYKTTIVPSRTFCVVCHHSPFNLVYSLKCVDCCEVKHISSCSG